MRPSSAPHGTRSRYVAGCRCAECRAANVRESRARTARARELAEAYPAGPPVPTTRTWTTRKGHVRTRTYPVCPGVLDEPCASGAFLRKDSPGGRICVACAFRLLSGEITAKDPMVDATRAREHLLELRALGVGKLGVAAASDIAVNTVDDIRAGRQGRLRSSTERRILEVDAGARGDGVLVPGGPTRRRLARLIALGLRRSEITRRLGNTALGLQLGKQSKVTLRSEHRVRRLLDHVLEEHKERERALRVFLSELPRPARWSVEAWALEVSPQRALLRIEAARRAWRTHRIALADPDTLCPACGFEHGPGGRRQMLSGPGAPRSFRAAHREWPCVHPDDPIGRGRFAGDLATLRRSG